MPVKISGLKETVRALQAAGVEVQDLKTAFGAISKRAANYAADFTPRRTGRLANSVRGSKAKNYAAVSAGGKSTRYAAPVNYGTGPRPGKRGPHNIKPAHFLQRADAKIRPEVIPLLKDNLSEIFRSEGLQ